jgi:nicotinamide mononucleotide (NMN) deamidase PncC
LDVVRAIHATETRAVLAVTGGGIVLLSDLLSVPGASRTVLEAVVPYSDRALAAWIGRPADRACTAEVALAMAEASRARAAVLAAGSSPVVGLGLTAALVSDRPKKGEHRAHIAVTGADGSTRAATITLAKGRRDRAEEDRVVADLALALLAAACGIDTGFAPSLLPEDVVSG